MTTYIWKAIFPNAWKRLNIVNNALVKEPFLEDLKKHHLGKCTVKSLSSTIHMYEALVLRAFTQKHKIPGDTEIDIYLMNVTHHLPCRSKRVLHVEEWIVIGTSYVIEHTPSKSHEIRGTYEKKDTPKKLSFDIFRSRKSKQSEDIPEPERQHCLIVLTKKSEYVEDIVDIIRKLCESKTVSSHSVMIV